MDEYLNATRERQESANSVTDSGSQPVRSHRSAASEQAAGNEEQPISRAPLPTNDKQEREALRAINPSLHAFYGDGK